MSLEHLFEANRRWAKAMAEEEADFFKKLVDVQTPALSVDRLLG